MASNRVKVIVRVRPFTPAEEAAGETPIVTMDGDATHVLVACVSKPRQPSAEWLRAARNIAGNTAAPVHVVTSSFVNGGSGSGDDEPDQHRQGCDVQ